LTGTPEAKGLSEIQYNSIQFGEMALTARAMASAAQGLHPMEIAISMEPLNFCGSRRKIRSATTRSSSSKGGVVICRNVWDGLVREHLCWNALVWSLQKTRLKRRSEIGNWMCLRQVLDDGGGHGVRKTRSTATDLPSVVAQNGRLSKGMVDRVEDFRPEQEGVSSEVGTSGRAKKSRSSNGTTGRKQHKKSTKTSEKDGEHGAGLKLDDVSDFSDSDEVGTDVEEDNEEKQSEADMRRSGGVSERSSRGRSHQGNVSAKGDVRVAAGVRAQSSGQEEIDLRFMFLEAIMERARKLDVEGVEEAMSGMSLAGLKAGPRAYHGLVVSYARSGDSEGAVSFCFL
jgi:hypothetical protein